MADPTANLFAQQEANRKASRRLVAGFILFITWLGFGGDIIWYLMSSNAADADRTLHGYTTIAVHYFPGIGLLFLAGALLTTYWAFAHASTHIVSSTGARRIATPTTEAEQRLANVVDEMAIASGVPRPRIWIIPDDAPNALTTGIDAQSAQMAVTQGLLDICSRDELQGVVGHEMGHIANLDVKLMTLLTALVGLVALLHNSAFRMMRFGGGGRGGRSSSRSRGGGAGILVIVLAVVWVISWLIAPLVTHLVVMKVGRSREFLADAMSAQYTRNPGALADALDRISHSTAIPDAIPASSAQLCIVDPSLTSRSERTGRWSDLMATHPPIAERIARLRQMAYQSASSPAAP